MNQQQPQPWNRLLQPLMPLPLGHFPNIGPRRRHRRMRKMRHPTSHGESRNNNKVMRVLGTVVHVSLLYFIFVTELNPGELY